MIFKSVARWRWKIHLTAQFPLFTIATLTVGLLGRRVAVIRAYDCRGVGGDTGEVVYIPYIKGSLRF